MKSFIPAIGFAGLAAAQIGFNDQSFPSLRENAMETGSCFLFERTEHNDLTMCEPVCGELGENFVGCLGTEDDYSMILNDDLLFMTGECRCEDPIAEFFADVIITALPDLAAIGCNIFFETMTLTIRTGISVTPVGAASNAGLRAGVRAAKTINRVFGAADRTGMFEDWYSGICGPSDWDDVSLFDLLLDFDNEYGDVIEQ